MQQGVTVIACHISEWQ